MLGVFWALSAALYTAVLTIISVMEAGTIWAVNRPIISLMVFLPRRTRPRGLTEIGRLIIILSVALMAVLLENEVHPIVLGLIRRQP